MLSLSQVPPRTSSKIVSKMIIRPLIRHVTSKTLYITLYGVCHASTRVVVTGLGIVSPLGIGVKHVWDRLVKGQTGVTHVRGDGYDSIPCKVAAYVPRGHDSGCLDLEAQFSKSELKTLSLSSAYALLAAKEALDDADWHPKSEIEKQVTGVAVGMGMVDLEDVVSTGNTLTEKGYSRVSPFFIPRILVNMAAGQISIRHGLQGPNHAVSTACTTGIHALGDAYNFIKRGDAKVMVCGGTEAVISPISIAAFARMRALSVSFNEVPEKASRPFDTKREGFVMGEGAGIVVLESLQHARDRKAKIYAEILGYGLSGDAYHITAPKEDGMGAYLCMKAALVNSGLDSWDLVSYVNAHATSTPIGDAVEVTALKKLFKEHVHSMAISSTKGATGHLLGAAGSVEAIFTILACHEGKVPPTVNLEEPLDSSINFVSSLAQSWPVSLKSPSKQRIALTNSFGFGGTNATLVISSMNGFDI